MSTLNSTAIALVLATTVAGAQAPTTPPASTAPAPQAQPVPPARSQDAAGQALTTLPSNAATLSNWYKQTVYDPGNNKIGEVEDVLVEQNGKKVLMVGVGGFLGVGEKTVAVPQDMIQVTTKDNDKHHLVMNSTKDSLKSAPGFKFDRTAMMWMADNAPATTTGQTLPPAPSTTPRPQAQVNPPPAPAPQAQPAPSTRPTTTEVSLGQVLTTLPANADTITHWYKQSVYDPGNSKIGEIEDVLVDHDGKIVALMIGVGGFLGMGEKHVAVPHTSVRATTKDNNKWYLVMNSNKDALKSAPGFKYDRTAMVWMPENAPATTGSSPTRR